MGQIPEKFLGTLSSGETVEPWAADAASINGMLTENCINKALSSQGDGTGVTQQAIASKAITGATTATPTVVTSTAHGRSAGDYVFIEGATGTTEINGLRVVTAPVNANDYTLTKPDGTVIGSSGTFGGTPTSYTAFVYKPGASDTAIIERFVGYAHDGAYSSIKYMDVTELTNGIEIYLYTNDTQTAALTALPVKIWLQWALNAGVDVGNADGGVGPITQALLRWTLSKGCGQIRVEGSTDQLIALLVRDDISGLLGQEVAIQGHIK
jgi:hypothetical protein